LHTKLTPSPGPCTACCTAEELLRLLAGHLGDLGGGGEPSNPSGSGGGGGAPPGMASLVDSLMQQLLSKEVLYQPMKASFFLSSLFS
jgi:hypothetical protein